MQWCGLELITSVHIEVDLLLQDQNRDVACVALCGTVHHGEAVARLETRICLEIVQKSINHASVADLHHLVHR